jgi:hypothetical protein
MNMIITQQSAMDARTNLVEPLIQNICEAINNHLISSCNVESFSKLKLSNEQIFPGNYQPSLWFSPLPDNTTVAETVKAKIKQYGKESGYNIHFRVDPSEGLPYITFYSGAEIDSLNVLDFSRLVLKCDLHPVQAIFLKVLYAGTNFNEDLRVDEKDIVQLNHNPIPELYGLSDNTLKFFQGVLNRSYEGPPTFYHRTRIGRRGGQTFLGAICAIYELYSNTNEDQIILHLSKSDPRTLLNFVQKMAESFPERNLRVRSDHINITIFQNNNLAFVSENTLKETKAKNIKTLIAERDWDPNTNLKNARVIEFADCGAVAPCNFDFPAWIMNPSLPKEDLLARRAGNRRSFDIEFGAK